VRAAPSWPLSLNNCRAARAPPEAQKKRLLRGLSGRKATRNRHPLAGIVRDDNSRKVARREAGILGRLTSESVYRLRIADCGLMRAAFKSAFRIPQS
jgi:hypothetical protein